MEYYQRKEVCNRFMRQKSLIATIYLKHGKAVTNAEDLSPVGNLFDLVRGYNDNGIDKIYVFDLSKDEEEHEINLHTLKEINHMSELPVYAGGNINRMEDIKKVLYTGCKKVILNGLKPVSSELAREGAMRFGKEKITLSLFNVDILFKEKEIIEENVSEIILLNEKLVGTIENVTEIPYTPVVNNASFTEMLDVLTKDETINGLAGNMLSDPTVNILALKDELEAQGIPTGHFCSTLQWAEFKLNSDGMIPVIVQDHKTNDVLMLAYMNEEAFQKTLSLGKMTYWSRSRNELWTKGLTSGHVQYVKSLSIDCDKDTILAKVSQVGAACHTGNRTCFYTNLTSDEYQEKNILKVFEKEYDIIHNRKVNPKEGSYTNYLFDKGLDKILKKIGEEATEIVIASKNPVQEEIKYEIADFLYHLMVLMVEKGIRWEDVMDELARR